MLIDSRAGSAAHCGAVVNVPLGLGAPCPYCNSMIRVDKNGAVMI